MVPLYGYFANSDDINFDLLPNRFVLKCNHGCGYNLLCDNKDSLNIKKTKSTLNKWLKEDFGVYNIEPHYSKINPRMIVCEEYLGDRITDYKFFCFNGEVKFLYVSFDFAHDNNTKIGFFNLDGTKINIERRDYKDIGNVSFPPFFNEMLNCAKLLCDEFVFVRVDFFVVNDKFYFSELTFTPCACMMPFQDQKYNKEWGEWLDISLCSKQK